LLRASRYDDERNNIVFHSRTPTLARPRSRPIFGDIPVCFVLRPTVSDYITG